MYPKMEEKNGKTYIYILIYHIHPWKIDGQSFYYVFRIFTQAMHETLPALLEAWREAPESCAAPWRLENKENGDGEIGDCVH